MSSRLPHLTCRLLALAVVAAPLLSLGGCKTFNFQKDFWSLDRYRDERAVDVDHRLEKADASVKNPF